MNVGAPGLNKTQPPVKISCPVHDLRLQADRHATLRGAAQNFCQNPGADATALKVRSNDYFANIDVVHSIFNADVATTHVIANYDVVSRGGPGSSEELVLSTLVPSPVLPLNHIAISLMMYGEREICVGYRRPPSVNIHSLVMKLAPILT